MMQTLLLCCAGMVRDNHEGQRGAEPRKGESVSQDLGRGSRWAAHLLHQTRKTVSWSWSESINVHTACGPVREVVHGAARLKDSSLSAACCQGHKRAESDLTACGQHS